MTVRYYPYFFTHLSQFYNTAQGINNWVKPLLPTGFLKREAQNQNNLYFLISGNQPEGLLTLECETGEYLLDASSTVNVDSFGITADQTVQPVKDFHAELPTPINSPTLTKQYTLSYVDVDVNQTYPLVHNLPITEGNYPYQITSYQDVVVNPVFTEPVEYRQELASGNEIEYRLLTVDSDIILVSDTTVRGDIYNASLTADRNSYYKLAAAQTALVDLSLLSNPDLRVLVDGVVDGTITLTWTIYDQIVSQTYFPANDRGYLPAQTIGKFMTEVTLQEIALSLLTLIETDNQILILLTFKELLYIWENILGNSGDPDDVLRGLPSKLNREANHKQALSPRRSTLDQAWLGYALMRCIDYLAIKGTLQFIPSRIKDLIAQLAAVVSQAVDVSIGLVYVGHDNYGYLIDQPSLPAAVMTNIFLHQYLSYEYNLDVHQAAARCHIFLQGNQNLRFDLENPVETGCLYKLLWNVNYGLHRDTISLLEQLVELRAEKVFTNFEEGLWVWLTQTLRPDFELESIDYGSMSDTFTQLQSDLYTRTQTYLDYTPNLVCSSWQELIFGKEEISKLLKADSRFYLAADNAHAFEQFAYLEAFRMLPYGYQWFSDEAQTYGAINALLKAMGELAFRWYLAYSVFERGRYIQTAQGIALTKWATFLGLERIPLQPDWILRAQVLPLIREERSKPEAILTAAASHFMEVDLVEPRPISVLLNELVQEWDTLTPEDIVSLDEDPSVVVLQNRYPSSNLIDSLTHEVVWSEVIPSLVVYTQQVNPIFTDYVRMGLAASIKLEMYASFEQLDVVRTFAYSY